MQIDRLQVVLKTRTHWEAADVGCKLAVRWFWPLLGAWVVCAIPFFFLASFLDDILWQIVLLWWFKPLYERPVLMTLSILVFDGRVTPANVIAGFRDARLWSYLTVARLSWQRASNSPIDALEDASMEVQSQRREWLFGSDTRVDLLASAIGLAFEVIVALSIVFFIAVLTQSELNATYSGLLKYVNINEITAWQSFCLLMAIFIAMAISAVFYVSVGFASYLNRRTIKEGWDLELGFKKIVNRLAMVLLMSVLLLPTINAIADEPNEDHASVLAEIHRDPKFNQSKTITIPEHLVELVEQGARPQQVEVEQDRVTRAGRAFATVLKVVLIAALIVFLIFVFNTLFKREGGGSAQNEDEQLSSGQHAAMKNLPRNALELVPKYWRRGRKRDAFALLYSTAVEYVESRFRCGLNDSDTEGDCLRKVRGIDQDVNRAFEEITRAWVRLAYANEMPSEHDFELALHRLKNDIAA